jgi:hypothetical protein
MRVDRLEHAAQLAAGCRVLDIGGKKMPNCDPKGAFARAYRAIQAGASEYRIVDVQQDASVDYVADLNTSAGVAVLRDAILAYRPETILCMETLEHINYHFEVMNVLAEAVRDYQTTVFITLPNNGNWIFNALGWNVDHSVAFFQSIAWRFVTRSNLGRENVRMFPCMQKYVWYWWLVYALGGLQPFNWGFEVRPRK